MIAVLCVARRSVYRGLANLDIYDESRDAFSFEGGGPVVAHPPCRCFSRLRRFSGSHELDLALGFHCVRMVESNGGVLEQPYPSTLFDLAGIPGRGFTMVVNQQWFGHRARKATWLYMVGVDPRDLPPYPLVLRPAAVTVDRMGAEARSSTPRLFAQWLLDVARLVR